MSDTKEKQRYWAFVATALFAIAVAFMILFMTGCSMATANRATYWLFADHLDRGQEVYVDPRSQKGVAECQHYKVQ